MSRTEESELEGIEHSGLMRRAGMPWQAPLETTHGRLASECGLRPDTLLQRRDLCSCKSCARGIGVQALDSRPLRFSREPKNPTAQQSEYQGDSWEHCQRTPLVNVCQTALPLQMMSCVHLPVRSEEAHTRKAKGQLRSSEDGLIRRDKHPSICWAVWRPHKLIMGPRK